MNFRIIVHYVSHLSQTNNQELEQKVAKRFKKP